MKKVSSLTTIILGIVLVLPTIVSAAWWNPFSWGGWFNSFFNRQQSGQVQNIPIYKPVSSSTNANKDQSYKQTSSSTNTTIDQASKDVLYVNCNERNYAPGSSPCSTLKAVDKNREDLALNILSSDIVLGNLYGQAMKITSKPGKIDVRGYALQVSAPRYELMSAPSDQVFNYYVVDVAQKQITDKIAFRGYELIATTSDKMIIVSNSNDKIYVYRYNNPTVEILLNSQLSGNETYMKLSSSENGAADVNFILNGNELTMSYYDKSKATKDVKNYQTMYEFIGTKVFKL